MVGLCESQQLQCVCELQPAFTPRPLAYKQEMQRHGALHKEARECFYLLNPLEKTSLA